MTHCGQSSAAKVSRHVGCAMPPVSRIPISPTSDNSNDPQNVVDPFWSAFQLQHQTPTLTSPRNRLSRVAPPHDPHQQAGLVEVEVHGILTGVGTLEDLNRAIADGRGPDLPPAEPLPDGDRERRHRIDPGAFALVGMATFYGGLAHVPIASLVMTCELAGSYDLLVPLMLAEGIAFVALRKFSLYHAQVPTKRESPAHREDLIFDVLKEIRVGDVMGKDRPFITFTRQTPARDVIQQIASSEWQDAFPVIDDQGKLAGIVNSEVLRSMAADPDLSGLALADDMMAAPVSVNEDDDLHMALELLLSNDVRELIVLNDAGRIVGFLDEAEITKTYHGRTAASETPRNAPRDQSPGA